MERLYEYIYYPHNKQLVVNNREIVEKTGKYFITKKEDIFGRKYRFPIEDEDVVLTKTPTGNYSTVEIFIVSNLSETTNRDYVKQKFLDHFSSCLDNVVVYPKKEKNNGEEV